MNKKTSEPEVSSDVTPTPAAQTKDNKYPVAQNYINRVGSHTMSSKYKDYLVLAPADNSIWNEKAEKLKKLADHNGYVWTHWFGYWKQSQITGQHVHKLCASTLSYSKIRTFLRIWAYRSYFDFLWNIFGRERKEKLSGWWYR